MRKTYRSPVVLKAQFHLSGPDQNIHQEVFSYTKPEVVTITKKQLGARDRAWRYVYYLAPPK